MKLGIVGLPNVGKSTLFNSLTKAGAESANYPFCTIDPNVGVVAVPDDRLDKLAALYNSAKITPAVIEFVDIAGLVKGASKGEGLGNQFLANIREVDAIVHVVRCFEDSNIVHVDGSIDPIRDIETINRKVRSNLDKEKAEEDAVNYQEQYKTLTAQLDKTRQEKTELLHNAGLPLPGLSVEDGELTYQGQKWDNMSGSDQLRVATAIVRRLNPQCGFVLLDKLEQMDLDTLNEFGEWLEQEGLQAIATRVSTGGECSIIIEDGYVKGEETQEADKPKLWKEGTF